MTILGIKSAAFRTKNDWNETITFKIASILDHVTRAKSWNQETYLWQIQCTRKLMCGPLSVLGLYHSGKPLFLVAHAHGFKSHNCADLLDATKYASPSGFEWTTLLTVTQGSYHCLFNEEFGFSTEGWNTLIKYG